MKFGALLFVAFLVACGEDAPQIIDASTDAPIDGGGNAGDRDLDGIDDTADNCPDNPNPAQENNDGDSQGDLCDVDDDNDTVADLTDNCVTIANTDQANHDDDVRGDACDDDDDADGLLDAVDNCPTANNPLQEDTDADLTPTAVAGTFALRPAPTTIGVSGDDNISAPLPIGFTFDFFGTPMTEFNLSTNGFITFGGIDDGCCDGGPIPSPLTPNGLIALYWVDLNTNTGGTITYGTQGTAPNRELVVSWNAVGHHSDGAAPVTGQIILHETTNRIELQCASCVHNNRPHSQGIENLDGTVGVSLPGRVAAAWSVTNDAVLISPGSPVPDGIGDACDVCPAQFNPTQVDADLDGIGDLCDLCPADADPLQEETDADGIGDACDNCPADANSDQADVNTDGEGDVCDDTDGDSVLDAADNCPLIDNPGQEDTDVGVGKGGGGDGIGDVCDNCPLISNPNQEDGDANGIGDACEDRDGDGVFDDDDNCPLIANPGQEDSDADGVGDVCDLDADNDGIDNATDNCPTIANPLQEDADDDGTGDVCEDTDGDGVFDGLDNCPLDPNPGQADGDGDGSGDVCDNDTDNDGIADPVDNCPTVPNPTQADSDLDGIGDVCDLLDPTFDQILTGGGIAASGRGWAGRGGAGVISTSVVVTLAGIPAGSTIVSAKAYWMTIGGGDDLIAINGMPVTGTLFATAPDTCWGRPEGNFGYRADVAALVTGNGLFTITGYPSQANGLDGQGITLLVVYTDPADARRNLVSIAEGTIAFQGSGAATSTLGGFTVGAGFDAATVYTVVADGQAAGDEVRVNGVELGGGDAYPGADGSYWDTRIDVVTSLVTAGDVTVTTTVTATSDCLAWTVNALVITDIESPPLDQ